MVDYALVIKAVAFIVGVTLPTTYFVSKQSESNQLRDFPASDICVYTPRFCDENIWKLAEKIKNDKPEMLKYCHAVFVSNTGSNNVLFYKQKIETEKGLTLWNYHVILVFFKSKRNSWVFDFDTEMNFPTKFKKYVKLTFGDEKETNPMFRPRFRVIPAEKYLKYYSTVRPQTPNVQTPSYPRIFGAQDFNNFDEHKNMEQDDRYIYKYGRVYDLNGFIKNFS